MLTEKRPGEILADFKKILDKLDFTPLLIFSPFYQEEVTSSTLPKCFGLQAPKSQVTGFGFKLNLLRLKII